MKNLKTFKNFVNENYLINEAKWEVLGSIGDFKIFDDPKIGKHIILILGKGMDQLEHPVPVKPKDTPEKLYNRFYQGRQINIKESFNENYSINEAKAYPLKASEFGTDTMTQPYKTKDDINIWRIHSAYQIDQNKPNKSDEKDAIFFEVMDIRDEIVVKVGAINNQTRSSGSTYGKFYVGTKDDFKKDSKKFAKEASDFLTKGDQGKINIGKLNKYTKSQGQKIKWAMKDDYSSVIEDLIKKALK